MKSFMSKLFAFSLFAVLCAVVFPQTAAARPIIRFNIESVNLLEAGEAEIVGHFYNEGDQAATVQWLELELTLIADNGQQMWADAGIRHDTDGIEILPGGTVDYVFYIQNPDIPEYHGGYRWRYYVKNHWELGVG